MNENKIVYRIKSKFFKKVISQEIVRKETKKFVFCVGKIFPIYKKKVFENPSNLFKKKNDITKKFGVLAFLLIFLSFFAPITFTRWSLYDLTNPDYANIANTIYGLTGPFIAIAAALLTYAAFVVQKRANDIQIESVNEEIEKNKIESFENLLFKLIETHRENVKELSVEIPTSNNEYTEIYGQEAIRVLRFTLSIISYLFRVDKDIKKEIELEPKEIQILSYLIFAHGLTLFSDSYFKQAKQFKKYAELSKVGIKVTEIINKLSKSELTENDNKTAYSLQVAIAKRKGIKILLNNSNNKMNTLSRYFRQIYQVYSFIDEQEFLTNEQKYKYAKMFRTNLTNNEQELIYNNILSPYGDPWRNKQLIVKYKPFKNVSSSGIYTYSPAEYLMNDFSIKKGKLSSYIDFISFTNEI